MPKKVLLIEYEPRYIERIRALVAPLGHTLTEAHDGEAGLPWCSIWTNQSVRLPNT